jgi:ribosomal protein S1
MSDADSIWLRVTTDSLPVGATVNGVVVDKRPFGVFLSLDGHPGVRAIVEINNYRPRGQAVASDELPTVDSRLEAVVVDHVAFNRQVRLRVAPRDDAAQ